MLPIQLATQRCFPVNCVISRSRTPDSISCVMPAFNEARSLVIVVPQTLAALQQLSPQVELIVVDDGSQDDTASVMGL